MKRILFLWVGLLLMSSGCETLSGRQRRQSALRQSHALSNLKARIQRLEARLDGVEAGREDVYAQVASLQATQERTSARKEAALEALESKLEAESAARTRMRREVVKELSGKMAGIMESHTPAPAARTQSGYEHTVKPGETLSEIASAYGVKIGAITRANKLKNPDDLRVGQTLFIPE